MIVATFRDAKTGKWSHSLAQTGREYASRVAAASSLLEMANEIVAFAEAEYRLALKEIQNKQAGKTGTTTYYATSTARLPVSGGAGKDVQLPFPNAQNIVGF